jgi:uncharacterized protein
MQPDSNALNLERTTERPYQQPCGASMFPDPASALRTRSSFAPGVGEKIGFCVYLLIDPRDEAVFYVGKGTGNRCFAHLAEARKPFKDQTGDYPKLDRIMEIEDAGEAIRIDILRHGLSEQEAFLVESVVIDLLPGLTNEVGGYYADELGRMSVSDINARYGAVPVEIDPSHCVVLIRINRNFERGMTDDALYEATRKWWKVGPAKRQLGMSNAPQWAIAVFGGIVRAVYRIETWERPTEADIAVDLKRTHRWGFRGQRDVGMEATYLSRDVSHYFRATTTSHASQNPIRYVNCQLNRQDSVR